jgi:hypothetical protein
MDLGTRVTVKSNASGTDKRFSGRKGIVVAFDASLPWSSPRALLAPNSFVCVHFLPVNAKERNHGSPMDLLDANNLTATHPDSA